MKFNQSLISFFEFLGKYGFFVIKIFYFSKSPDSVKNILIQSKKILFQALLNVIFSGFFIGGILVFQFYFLLSKYNATLYLGGLTTSSIIREVGPLMISFLISGKVGAYTAAELATMRVTDQIDAIHCLGTDPIEYLVTPRYFGIVLASFGLLCMGTLMSLFGSSLLAAFFFKINPKQFGQSLGRFIDLNTFFFGFIKCSLYSFIVATVSCFYGYHADGGAQGVGKAVTKSAVFTNLYIVIMNYLSGLWINSLRG